MSRQLAGGKTFQETIFLRHYIVLYFIFLNQRLSDEMWWYFDDRLFAVDFIFAVLVRNS